MIKAEGNSPEAWVRAVVRAIWRFALWAAIIAGVIYVTGRLKLIIIYLFIGATLAYVIRPMAGWLARRPGFVVLHDAIASVFSGMARPVVALFRRILRKPNPVPTGPLHLPMHSRRVVATIYVLILLFVGGYFSVKFTLNPFVSEIQNVAKNWDVYKKDFANYSAGFESWYLRNVSPEWRSKIEKAIKENSLTDGIQKQATEWVGVVGRRFGDVVRNIVEIVLLPVLAFYFALDSKKIKHEIVGALPARWRRETLRMIHEFNRIMNSFVVGQAILCALAGVVVGLGLWALQVKYPLMLGILAGFTRAIPIIGPIIGGIPIIFLALVTKGVGVALGVLAFFTFLHFAESKFIMPYLIGERMKLHPVVIIIVLLIGEEFGGLLGMFFAAPVAALIRVIVRRYWLKSHRKPLYRHVS